MLTDEQAQKIREEAGIKLKSESTGDTSVLDAFNNYDFETKTTKKTGFIQDIKGMFTRTGEDILRRGSNIKELVKTGVTAKEGEGQTGAETGFQIAGQIAGGFGDIFGNTVIGGIKALLPQIVEDKISQVGKNLLDTKLGEQAVIALSNGMQSYQDWKKDNSRFASNLEASLNIGDFAIDIATFGATKAGKEALEEAGEKLLKKEVKGKGFIRKGIDKISDTNIAKDAKELAETSGESASRTLFGIDLDTAKQVFKDPKKFRELARTVDRESVTKKFVAKLDERLQDLSDIGKNYNPIRKSKTLITTKTDDVFKNALSGKGIDLTNGKITLTKASRENLTSGDISKLEDILVRFDGQLDSDSFLNLRHTLSEMSNFDKEASKGLQNVAREIRGELNKSRDQIKGLKILDDDFAKEIKILNPIKKKIFNADGTLKDNAISIISNMTGKNKEIMLKNFSEIMPDLEDNLKILKSIEAVDLAQGTTVGSYTKGALRTGGIVGGVALGSPLLVIGSMLLTSPKSIIVMLDILKSVSKVPVKVINGIKNKIVKGIKLSAEEAKIVSDMIKDNAADLAASMARKGGIENLEK